MKKKNSPTWALIILFLICGQLFQSCNHSSSEKSNSYYYEHKATIDAYERRHKDDWKGYNGTRRNSWAEDQELEKAGYDPETYRKQHGY